MKKINFRSCLRVGVVCLAFGLSGCVSIPNSPTPRFYALSAISGTQVSKTINIPAGVIISIGPVKIPEYQDRPQIVTKDKEGMLKFDEFNRWGESLDHGVTRLIREDLSVLLPKAKLIVYPSNPLVAVKYQVALEVIDLDSELDGDMSFVVQWTVIDVQNSKVVMMKRSEFRTAISPQNYFGLANTLSKACASLSSQIAEALANNV